MASWTEARYVAEAGEEGRWWLQLYLLNASNLPIFDVRFEDIAGHERAESVVRPDQEPQRFADIAGSKELTEYVEHSTRPLRISFTDAQGYTWERDRNGELILRGTPRSDTMTWLELEGAEGPAWRHPIPYFRARLRIYMKEAKFARKARAFQRSAEERLRDDAKGRDAN